MAVQPENKQQSKKRDERPTPQACAFDPVLRTRIKNSQAVHPTFQSHGQGHPRDAKQWRYIPRCKHEIPDRQDHSGGEAGHVHEVEAKGAITIVLFPSVGNTYKMPKHHAC